MAGERQLPGLGLTGFWNAGAAYKAGMDANLRILSALVQPAVLSRVTALPASPPDGAVYLVPAGAAQNANKVAVRDAGAWVFLAPSAGWRVFVVDEASFAFFDGTGWIAESATGGDTGGGGSAYAPVAWRIRAFASADGTYLTVGDMDFLGSTGASLPRGTGAPLASTAYSGATEAANAFDNDPSTRWASSTSVAWGSRFIGFNYGVTRAAEKLRLRAPNGFASEMPSDFIIESSADLGTWNPHTRYQNVPAWSAAEVREYVVGEVGAVQPWYVDDAPKDGFAYGRKNGAWVKVTAA